MYVRAVHTLMSTESENKKYSLQAITVSERGKREGSRGRGRQSFNKMSDLFWQVSYVQCWELRPHSPAFI